MAEPDRSDRLGLLTSDYEACRDDERSFTALSAALYGVTVAMLGLLAAAMTQTCAVNPGMKTCAQVPGYLVAAAPLLPLTVFAYAQAQATISVLRNYYMRGLEGELGAFAPDPIKAFRAISPVPPMSSVGVVAALTSLRPGRVQYRLLINFIFVAVITVFGGLTVYIGAHLSAGYRIAMLAVYGPIAYLLITQTYVTTVGGRRLFTKALQAFARTQARGTELRQPQARAERGLLSYLLIPRQEEFVKWLIAPAVFVVAAGLRGTLGGWPRFLLLWFVFEYLIYNARYQWNDARGIDEDEIHAARSSRRRLPVPPGSNARAIVAASLAVAAFRILAAVLIGLAAGMLLRVLALTAVVFGIAIGYEALRSASRPSRRALRAAADPDARIYAIWVVVGLGYAVRASVGYISARVPLDSAVMITGLAFFAAFGSTFVLLTWVLEATSYCRADVGPQPAPGWSQAWRMARPLAQRPHIRYLLRFVDVHVEPVPTLDAPPDPGDAGYCGTMAVLRSSARKKTPWNVAFVAGAALGAAAGVSLAAPPRDVALLLAVAVVISVAGALAVAADDRPGWQAVWAVLAACALSLLPVGGGTAVPAAIVGCVPWIAITGLYVTFRSSSYSDLMEWSPAAIAGRLREPWYLMLVLILRAVVGAQTWQRLTGPPSRP